MFFWHTESLDPNDELIQKVLNLEDVIEIGDSAYKTPYETC